MHPVIFEFGPITIYSYGLMLFIAALVSLNLLLKEGQRTGYDKNTIFDLGIVILLSGIAGARILYILLNLSFYANNPKEIFMLQRGGLAIFGGIILSTAAGFIFVKIKKLDFLKITDLIIPYVALGQSIGRIGCFFNGCCYGMPCNFGIYFPVHGAVLIPAQLIDSFFMLILYIVLRFKQLRPHATGMILANYFMYYSVLRFFIEFIRGDSQRLFLGLTIFQYFCIFLFTLGTILFLNVWKRKLSK